MPTAAKPMAVRHVVAGLHDWCTATNADPAYGSGKLADEAGDLCSPEGNSGNLGNLGDLGDLGSPPEGPWLHPAAAAALRAWLSAALSHDQTDKSDPTARAARAAESALLLQGAVWLELGWAPKTLKIPKP